MAPTIPSVKFQQLRLRLLAECSYETIDRMIANLESYAKAEHADIEKQVKALASEIDDADADADANADELAWEKFQLEEEHSFLKESLSLAHELSIVALYKKIEISTKRAVTTAFPEVSAHSLFKIKDMKNALARKGIDIEKLPNFKAFDELRCINNDVKHSGQVGSELAVYGWKHGKNLSDLDDAYKRLAPLASKYVSELVGELLKLVK